MRYLFLLLQFFFIYFTPAMFEVAYPDFGQYSAYGSPFNENSRYGMPSINNAQSMKYQFFPQNTLSQTNFQNPSSNKKYYAYDRSADDSDEDDNRTWIGEEQDLWSESTDAEDNVTVNMNNEGLLYDDIRYSLENLDRRFNIVGYNLYNLLKKNSSVRNRDKLKIDEYYGINVDLLGTLGRIINNQTYPSLYLKNADEMEAYDQSDLEDEDTYFEDDGPNVSVTLETSDDEATDSDEDHSDGEGTDDQAGDGQEVDADSEDEVNNGKENEEDIDNEDGTDLDVDVDNENRTEAVSINNGENEEVDVDSEEESAEDVDNEEGEELVEDIDNEDDLLEEEETNIFENDDDIFSGSGGSTVSSEDNSSEELIGGIVGGLVGGAALGVLGGSLLGEEAVSGVQSAIDPSDHVSYSEDDAITSNDDTLDSALYEEDTSNLSSDDESLNQNDNIITEESAENIDQVENVNEGDIGQEESVVGEETIIDQSDQEDTWAGNIDDEKSVTDLKNGEQSPNASEDVINQDKAVKKEADKIEKTPSDLMLNNSEQEINSSEVYPPDILQKKISTTGSFENSTINPVTQELASQLANVEMTIQEFINSGHREVIFKELHEPRYLNKSDSIVRKSGTSIFIKQIDQDEPMKRVIIQGDGKIHAKDF